MAKKQVKEETTEEKLEALIKVIDFNTLCLQEELAKCRLDNASAARRARKLTLELSKQFKEFRALSVAYFKK